jgi:hypothetical protein
MKSDFILGKPFPNISMTDRAGHTVTLSQLVGSWLVLFTSSQSEESEIASLQSITQPLADMAVLLAGFVSPEFPAMAGVVILKDEGSPLADKKLFIIDHNGILRKDSELAEGLQSLVTDLQQLQARWLSAW